MTQRHGGSVKTIENCERGVLSVGEGWEHDCVNDHITDEDGIAGARVRFVGGNT